MLKKLKTECKGKKHRDGKIKKPRRDMSMKASHKARCKRSTTIGHMHWDSYEHPEEESLASDSSC